MGEALTLAILLTLKDEASKNLDKLGTKFQGLRGAVNSFGLAAAAGVGMLGAALYQAGQAAAEEERGIVRLAAAVRASGGDWAEAEQAIESYLAAELKRTALDDGAGREAIARLTMATGDYRQALNLMGLAQDLAAAKGLDVASAADIVGRVANGNTSILARYGITLQEGATATEALAAMQQMFAGQAEAYGQSAAGAQERLNIALGNLKETVGAAVLPVMTELATRLGDLATAVLPYVQQGIDWMKEHTEIVIPVLVTLSVLVGATMVAAFWAMAGAAITAAASTMVAMAPVVLPIIAITAAVGALAAAWHNDWGGMRTKLTEIWEGTLRPIWEAIQRWFTETLPNALGILWSGYRQGWENIRNLLTAVWNDVLKPIWEAMQKAFRGDIPGALADLWAVFRRIWGEIRNFVGNVWAGLTDRLHATLDNWRTTVAGIWDTVFAAPLRDVRARFEQFWNGLRDWISNIFSNIHIPLPHFRVDWTEIAGVRIPSGVHVDWYAHGGDFIVRQPTLIGVGEAGPERVTIQPLGSTGAQRAGEVHYHLNYYASRERPGREDAVAAMRRLEWLVRMRAA